MTPDAFGKIFYKDENTVKSGIFGVFLLTELFIYCNAEFCYTYFKANAEYTNNEEQIWRIILRRY